MTLEEMEIAKIIEPEAFVKVEPADDYPAWKSRRQALQYSALIKAEKILKFLRPEHRKTESTVTRVPSIVGRTFVL